MYDLPACAHYLKFLLHKGERNPGYCLEYRGTVISYLSILLLFHCGYVWCQCLHVVPCFLLQTRPGVSQLEVTLDPTQWKERSLSMPSFQETM